MAKKGRFKVGKNWWKKRKNVSQGGTIMYSKGCCEWWMGGDIRHTSEEKGGSNNWKGGKLRWGAKI